MPYNHKIFAPQKGFTLIEIVVSTTIFVIVTTAMMSLFNYTLKINRRAEALRQATQGVRNFTEYIVKTVRNGQIDFSVNNATVQSPISPCPKPIPLAGQAHDGSNTYLSKENRLGLITPEGERLCLYLGDSLGNAVTSGFVGETLVIEKTGFKQVLNPPYFKVENLMFLIRPQEDPYYTGAGGLVRVQPFVTVIMKVIAQLPTGETQPIYYQTTISSDQYDIPNN
jgi:prepilin-type N-terminal cleavage/methylation domain-containing protein